MSAKADVLLDVAAVRRWHIAGDGILVRLLKVFLDRMPHQLRLDSGFALRLDAKPGLSVERPTRTASVLPIRRRPRRQPP